MFQQSINSPKGTFTIGEETSATKATKNSNSEHQNDVYGMSSD